MKDQISFVEQEKADASALQISYRRGPLSVKRWNCGQGEGASPAVLVDRAAQSTRQGYLKRV